MRRDFNQLIHIAAVMALDGYPGWAKSRGGCVRYVESTWMRERHHCPTPTTLLRLRVLDLGCCTTCVLSGSPAVSRASHCDEILLRSPSRRPSPRPALGPYSDRCPRPPSPPPRRPPLRQMAPATLSAQLTLPRHRGFHQFSMD